MTEKKRVILDMNPLLFERWIRSRDIAYGEVSERLRMLIEADTELTIEEKERQEIEKDIQEIDNEIRQLEKKRANLVMRLKDMDARDEKQKEEMMQMRDWMAEEAQEMIARGR